MVPGIERCPVPEWLMQLSDKSSLPIRQLLTNSLYYPASGMDGDPVRYLVGFIHSFVYVDYMWGERNDVWKSLHDEHHGFKGYEIIFCRDVQESELSPHGWRPIPPNLHDGDPSKYKDQIKKPFALWSIQERKPDFGDNHGPERFSFLYICGEGVATFQALYYGNECAPDVVAIIRSDGLGCSNWTSFRAPSQIFARSVLNNPTGKPRFLLCDGRKENPQASSYWPEYSRLIHYWKVNDGELRLWKMQS